MKIKTIVSILALSSLSIGNSLFAQDDDKAKNKDQRSEQQADRGSSFTGCLTEQQGTFILKTSSGEQYNATGSADLSKHANHTVTLSGSTSEEGGKKMLSVTKIEHVSGSCSK